jgi:hypothetical protein
MRQYRDLGDYIRSRARDMKQDMTSLSLALGFGQSYINSVVNEQFVPSQKRCRLIAEYFGDDPNIILAFAGYYEPPEPDNPFLADLEQIARSLPRDAQQDLLRYAQYLKTSQDSQNE